MTNRVSKFVVLPLCVAMCWNATSSAAVPTTNSSAPGTDPSCFLNCGVNAGYFCSQWFSRPTSLAEFARTMDAGDMMESNCSFAELSAALAQSRLKSTGLKADSVSEALSCIKPPSVGILRLSRMVEGEDVGHFVVAVPLKEGFAIVDPPRKPIVLSAADAASSSELAKATGEVLIVSDGEEKAQVHGPVLKLESNTLDLGRIPIGVNQFDGVIKFENPGSQTLRILNTKVSCGCMSAPVGDLALEPGKSGQLKITFDRTKSSSGDNVRSLLITTNDPSNARVLVTFKFSLVVAPTSVDANVMPRQIDYGRESSASIAAESESFILTLPLRDKQQFDQLRIRAESDSSDLELTATNSSFVPIRLDPDQIPATQPTPVNNGLATLKYQLRWKKVPSAGVFTRRVTFTVSQDELGTKKFEIPIRGESY